MTPEHKVPMAFCLVFWSLLLFVFGSVIASMLMVSFAFCFVVSASEILLMEWVRSVSPAWDEMVGAPAWACSCGQSRFCVWCPCVG